MAPLFYLKTLVIQNFATFKNQSIEFEKGFNGIIGETGSGKSLVLEAIELILGGRADKKIVRKNTDTACIEARFICHDPKIHQFFKEEGYLIEDNEIIIKRLISKHGSTKNYINHQSCTVTLLANFSKSFIDIVGQFDNQKLLSDQYQLALLDQFAKNESLLSEYQEKLSQFKTINKKISDLTTTQSQRNQRLDYLNYQLDEINRLNPSSQDEEELIKKKNVFLNLEKSQRISAQVIELFEGSEGSTGLDSLTNSLSHLILRNRDLLDDYSDKIINIIEELRDLQQGILLKLEQDIDPGEYEFVLERLDLYQKLKHKFSGTVEGILQFQVDFLKEKTQLEELDFDLKDIIAKKETLNRTLELLADKLHKSRLQHSPLLAKELSQKIRSLNMTGATIEIKIDELSEFDQHGKSKVSFLAETNKGEGFFKIKDVASGGELSRILLGLRQVLSRYDSIGIFLFDEIDTGIGGETALTIGKALSEVASQGQVIAITHLPQIAKFASNLIVVEKQIQELDEEVRTESLVKMLRGKSISQEVRAMVNLQ
ncbi:MAG: AAA family ATPase [Bacteriovoracaceae bacterium]